MIEGVPVEDKSTPLYKKFKNFTNSNAKLLVVAI